MVRSLWCNSSFCKFHGFWIRIRNPGEKINIVECFVVIVIVMIFFRNFRFLFASRHLTSGETASNISDTVNPELGDICLYSISKYF
jgi:hypothetical protein